MIDFQVRHYERLGSTNDEAQRLAAEGAPHGTVVHTDEQTAGRGRLSRRWLSPPGNLYLSIVLRPDVAPARVAEIGFLAALAVADAVDALLPRQLRATLKWPNDVLVSDGKIAGILAEQAGDAVILGIGLDVLQAPTGLSYKVSTIVGCGGLATVDGARDRVLAALANWMNVWEQDGFAAIRAAWLARAHPVGSALSVQMGDRFINGLFAGLDDEGALLLDDQEARHRIVAGDVQLR
ncbi:MAG TPA: biotin--[acetyl-CoA-carboxylase] ligase [Acetobacteraceae bacterium]|nr:biotin--[acetyl-CoA-carboxylase] ligase [Acetobacteraceae bacterium]